MLKQIVIHSAFLRLYIRGRDVKYQLWLTLLLIPL